MINIIQNNIRNYKRYISYGIVGVCTTFVSYMSYYLLYSNFGINPNIANLVSILFAVLFAYVTNKIFVFKSKCPNLYVLWLEFVKFISSRAITMVIEIVGVFIILEWQIVDEMWAKIITSIVIVILNYVLSYFFVFNS